MVATVIFWNTPAGMRVWLLCVFLAQVSGQIDHDGKAPIWEGLTHAQLAPELQELNNALRPRQDAFDLMEDIKDSVDQNKPLPSLFDSTFKDSLMATAISKAIIDNTPGFKLPPGAAFPMAPGVGHFTVDAGNGMEGIPNLAKNMDSGIQRDAINAAVGTTRLFRPLTGSNVPTDAFSTRQSSDHPRYPTYAGYLKQLQERFAVSSGYGLGSVPSGALHAIGAINPLVPITPGALGSGVDLFGLNRSQMSRPVNDNGGSHLLYPFSFSPQSMETARSGVQQGFSVPHAVMNQVPNDVYNAVPKALAYGMSTSVSPLSGIQPWFA